MVLVGPLATPQRDISSILSRQMAFNRRIDEPLFEPESKFMAEKGDIIAHYASRQDIVFIRPDRVQCNLGKCDYFQDGTALFADDSHVAQAALPLFRPIFEPALKQAFIRTNQASEGVHP